MLANNNCGKNAAERNKPTGEGLWVRGYGLRVTGYGLWVMGYGKMH